MSTPYTIHVGQRLTDYGNVDVTVERVAAGGMGLVAFGKNQMSGGFVVGQMLALKTIKLAALQSNPDLRERFIREGLTWSGLWPHPNILTAQGVTQIDGLPFLMLDYAEQGSLAHLLKGGPLTLASALMIAQHIAAGLIALHTPDPGRLRPDPIVHRDLKPDNVLIMKMGQRQFAQITDFGLVALLPQVAGSPLSDEDTRMEATHSSRFHTRQGSVLGTVAYMAPEQWIDITLAGPPVDVYALGLILAQCITGAHPLLLLDRRHSLAQWRAAHAQSTPQLLQSVVPEVPVPLERLYLSMLAKRAEDRPTAQQMLAGLNAVAQRLSLPPYTPPEVLDHTPEHEMIWWDGWGHAYFRFELWPEALACNDRANQLAPHHPNVLLSRGNILIGMQRWDEALACYEASLQAYLPEDHIGRKVVYNEIGILHSKQRKYVAAEMAYVQALADMPDAADIWYNRGNNERQWGSAEATAGNRASARTHLQYALAHYTHAQRLAPNDTGIPNGIAFAQHELARLGG